MKGLARNGPISPKTLHVSGTMWFLWHRLVPLTQSIFFKIFFFLNLIQFILENNRHLIKIKTFAYCSSDNQIHHNFQFIMITYLLKCHNVCFIVDILCHFIPRIEKMYKWIVSRVGGLGNKGSCCPRRILSLSAFVTVCVTHQRQSGGTTSSNT